MSYCSAPHCDVCAPAMNGVHAEHPSLVDDLILPENAEEEEEIEEDENSEAFEDDQFDDSDIDRNHDRQAFGIYQQLPVSNGEPDLNREPQTAEEYLQQVR